ncbi:MAG: PH domain-containing protein [Pseudonocardia sp.]|nr:PH domain-containing protein [Pseudonocardia sp.]
MGDGSAPVTTGAATPVPASPPTGDDGWTTLDGRTVAVTVVLTAALVTLADSFVLVGVAIRAPAVLPVALAVILSSALVIVAWSAVAARLRWGCARYRVTPERVEVRSGVLMRRRRSLALHRVRTVDVTAGPVLRTFGLVALRVGTGQRSGTGETTLSLRPIERIEGDRLRTVLLDAMRSAGGPQAGPGDGRIAGADPRWMRYGLLTAATPLLAVGVPGILLQLTEWLGVRDSLFDAVGDAARIVSPAAVGVGVGLVLLVVGGLCALALYLETWGGFRLDREPGGTLRVRRGVVTTRSISLEERRLHGVELVEPLGVRLAGAARIDAVATGLIVGSETESTEHRTLLPAAPRSLAERVAAVVLGEPQSPTAAPLTPHPPAARRRRLAWALPAAVAPVLALALPGLLVPAFPLVIAAAVLAVLAVPVAVLLARDAAANLGHGLTGRYLVTRSGSLRRSTVALRRDGVIGWRIRQSPWQRHAGLVSVTATTAAGRGAFTAHDADAEDGIAFAAGAVPGLLSPFLRERAHAPARPGPRPSRSGSPQRAAPDRHPGTRRRAPGRRGR